MVTIKKENYAFKLDKENKPSNYVSVNDILEFETQDCFSDQIKVNNYKLEELNFDAVNPVTGVVYIDEAKKGDILGVTIEKITLNSKGVLASTNLIGTLNNKLETSEVKLIDISNNKAKLYPNIEIDLNQMIGVIGVAPKEEGIICGAPDYHGGNMDTKEIKEGSTIYFRVNVDGALLGLGDLHAAMGDGEVGGTGIEVNGKVKISMKLLKEEKFPTPAIKVPSENKIYFIYSDESLDIASDKVTEMAFDFLTENLNMDKYLAVRYLSVAGNLGISQIVDPKKTAKMSIDLLPIKNENPNFIEKFNLI